MCCEPRTVLRNCGPCSKVDANTMSEPIFLGRVPAALRLRVRAAVFVPLIGVLLALPALGPEVDDHVLKLIAQGSHRAVAPSNGYNLFHFASGDQSENLELMAQGSMLPWWCDPQLKNTFFRPLSGLLHRLDFVLFGDSSELMYAHSLLWFGVLLFLVARLYARVESDSRAALLASCLYAINDAHGAVVAWLSNRNAVVCAVFSVAALLSHQRAQSSGHRPSRLLAPLWLALSLFAGEFGVTTWAWLVAYALAFERGPLLRRGASLWRFALVTLVWLGAYAISGAGTRYSGMYLDPLREFPDFLAAFPRRALTLLSAAVGPMPADLAVLGPAGLALTALAIAPVIVVALALVHGRALWTDSALRFWCVGTSLSLVPVAATLPNDRLLTLVNVGAMGLVGRTLVSLWQKRATIGLAAYVLGGFLFVTHGPLAALLLPWRAAQMQLFARATDHAFACLDEVSDLPQKTLIVLGAPTDFFVSYLQAARAVRGGAQPRHVYWLTNPDFALDVTTVDERTLSFRRGSGFFMSAFEQLYRKPNKPLAMNSVVHLPGLAARVTEVTSKGTPTQVEFAFDDALTTDQFVFLVLGGATYERISPAALDGQHILAAMPLPELLLKASAY